MKALKEKRIGVRSLLRRGLIILSLFALVFAVACGGDEGSNNDPGTDPVDPVPVAKTVTDIVVLKQPSNVSFQGAAPDLTGLVARVYFSDGTSEMVDDPTKFVGVPAYCDVVLRNTNDTPVTTTPSPTATPTVWQNPPNGLDTTHAIAYVGHTEKTAGVVLPWVVPLKQYDSTNPNGLYSLQLTGSAKKVWYSDEIPTFEGLVLEGFYEDYVVDGKLVKNQKRTIPITATYPALIGVQDFDAAANPVLSFGVGYHAAATNDGLDDVDNYDAYVSFNIDKIVKVSGIEVDSATSTFADYFDDDIRLTKDPAAVLKDLTDNNTINLIVSYFDGTQRNITFADYLANLAYYNSRRDPADPVLAIKGTDGVEGHNTDRSSIAEVLNITEDPISGLPYFNLVLNYVPSIWGPDKTTNIASTAWVDTFDIPLPVYTFYTAVATRKEGSGTSDVSVVGGPRATSSAVITTTATWADTPASSVYPTVATAKGDHLMQGLDTKWELTGTYEREGVMKEKKVPLTTQMFADGITTTPNSAPATATNTFILDCKAQGYDWSDTNASPSGLRDGITGRGYVLPIWYRGEMINDAEMGAVTVNLVGPNP